METAADQEQHLMWAAMWGGGVLFVVEERRKDLWQEKKRKEKNKVFGSSKLLCFGWSRIDSVLLHQRLPEAHLALLSWQFRS